MRLTKEEKKTLKNLGTGPDLISINRSELSSTLLSLEDKQLIKISRSKDDIVIYLSDEGRAILKDNPNLRMDAEDKRKIWKWAIATVIAIVTAASGVLRLICQS